MTAIDDVRAGIDAAVRLGSADDLEAIRDALVTSEYAAGPSALVDLVDQELGRLNETAADEVDGVRCAWCHAIVPRGETYPWRDRSGAWHRQCRDRAACRRRVSARRMRPSKRDVARDVEGLRRRVEARERRRRP